MIFDRQQVHFSAGDVTCIARNVPHTTWSDPGKGSLWSYLFLDPEALLGRAPLGKNAGLPDTGRFLSDCHLLLTQKKAPWAGTLVNQIIEEMLAAGQHQDAEGRGRLILRLVRRGAK